MKITVYSPIVRAAFLTIALSVAPTAQALDVWTSPNPGLLHLHRTTVAPEEFNALLVDLSHPGVKIRVTPRDERWQTTSSFAIGEKLSGAINAGPWSLFEQQAMGLAASNGEIWSRADRRHGFFAVTKNGMATIVAPYEAHPPLQDIFEGVAGFSMLVEAGKVAPKTLQLNSGRDARTAVGVSKDGRTVILVTADGRQTGSVGASLEEVAKLMIELGADRAINLDGGNSTTMFIAREGGVVNHPSRGWERETVTHIGVQAPAPPPAKQANPQKNGVQQPDGKNGNPPIPTMIVETPQAVQELAASPIPEAQRGTRGRLSAIWLLDRIFIGQAREWIIPVLEVALPLALALLTAIWIIRAIRARRG